MSAFDKGAFRAAFPEFASTVTYPDAMLDFWLTVAGGYVDAIVWDALYTAGMSLCLAHHLVIAHNNSAGDPGASGLISSQSAGDVSVSYDTNAASEDKAGQWNLTSYGKQYIRMARLIGGVATYI